MPSRKPKCFVAIAFDRDDTDALYDESIEPVLRELGITPIIINRRQSNDDLNHQIIGSLDDCDFCIADLTYTRPSVYFEAGYAERLVPVIYSVRRDHLGRTQPDEARVHFDLQMKPLLLWKTPGDSRFRESLRTRIVATFLRSWNRSIAADDKITKARSAFSSHSLISRIRETRRTIFSGYAAAGLRKWQPFGGSAPPTTDLSVLERPSGPLYSTARRNDSQRVALTVVTDSANAGTFRDLIELTAFIGLFGHAAQGSSATLPSYASVLVVSLTPFPAARFARLFPSFDPTENPTRFRHSDSGNPGEPETVRTVELIAPVRSGIELKHSIRNAIAAAFAPTA